MQMKDIVYRKGTVDDLDAICDLVSRAIKNMIQNHIYQWDELYPTREDFQADIEKGELTVGQADGEIAVIYTLNQEYEPEYNDACWERPDGRFCVVHRLCVDPAFQNQGVAANTMRDLENCLTSQDVESVRLDAFSGNPYSLRLYQKCGYRRVGQADWRMGRFYLFEKIL